MKEQGLAKILGLKVEAWSDQIHVLGLVVTAVVSG
jgi:hypothetical protein